jgi:REP element-mobilizing transposase RayT
MARPLRLVFENAYYHVMAHGVRQENIFCEDRDRVVFLNKMHESFTKYNAVCYAYCLMDSHYHLFMKTVFPNLPQMMHYLNSSYANWFKAKYETNGPLFQGRYKSILVDRDNYGLVLSAYIHLNPIRNGIIAELEDYKWSSFSSYMRKTRFFDWLDTDFILSYFNKSRKRYKQYVYEQIGRDLSKNIYKGCILGNRDFIDDIKDNIDCNKFNNREIPQSKFLNKKIKVGDIMRIVADSLQIKIDDLYEKRYKNVPRKIAIYVISRYTSLDLASIGELFRMDYSAVSQLVRRFKAEMDENKHTRKITETIIKRIKMSNVET